MGSSLSRRPTYNPKETHILYKVTAQTSQQNLWSALLSRPITGKSLQLIQMRSRMTKMVRQEKAKNSRDTGKIQ